MSLLASEVRLYHPLQFTGEGKLSREFLPLKFKSLSYGGQYFGNYFTTETARRQARQAQCHFDDPDKLLL